MPETRKWLLPWGMDDNNNPNDPDDPEPTGPASEADNKASTRKPPQYTMESAEIIIPDEGLKEGQPYKFKGKVRRLDGAAPSNASISVQSVYRYNNEEQICGNPEIAEINKDTLEFTGEFDELFEPNAYYLDRNKTSDSKFILILKLRGGCLDKDSFSSEVKLPMATKDYILKKGCYDETWADAKKDDAAYPKSGDKYFPKDTVNKVQTLLIKLKFLNTGNDTGYYGDLTESAIHEFQLISKGQKRSKSNDGRIFDIHKADITFKGTDDGIYGPETERELAQWNANGYVRPKEDFKINDVDENGVRNGHGDKKSEKYHEGNQILDYQKLLKDIGAYPHKLDGWMGPKMEAGIVWLKECIEKCDFMDLSGKKAKLDLKELIKGHRPKHADEALKKAAEKVKENKAKLPSKDIADPAWITIARKEIGTQEIDGVENNPRIIEYHAATDGKASTDEVPWCSAFANYVLKEAGINGTNNANAFSWKTWGKKVDKPCYGCIAICDFGHVGFIVGKRTYPPDREGLLMLGGNQGKTGKGRVCVSWMPQKDMSIFRVPSDFNNMNYELKDIDGDFHEINRGTTR